LRPRPSLRPTLAVGALSLAASGVAAVPSVAQDTTTGAERATDTNAVIARVGFDRRRLHVRAGRRVVVIGTVRPGVGGATARLQLRRGAHWVTVARDTTGSGGRYVLRDRIGRALSAPARVVVRSGDARLRRRVGRVNAYRVAHASWYGPGLYGNRLGCGGRLGTHTVGVAHKTLPCGTRLTLRHGRRSLRVRVIDRGPYVGGREYDLTAAAARKLHFGGHGGILTTR
jgi:rare lipoprotein A